MEQVTFELAIEVLQQSIYQEACAACVLQTIDAFNSKTAVVGAIHSEGKSWNASIFSCVKGKKCAFYQKCLEKQCESEVEANIVIKYGRNFAKINQGDSRIQGLDLPAINLN